MSSSRMDAFSDGVIAIIITIMVLELKAPHAVTAEALREVSPVFLSYILSFIVVAIFWVNHHHLTHQLKPVDGRVLWLNNHLLFWLSLIPFATAYLGEAYIEAVAVACYGLVLAACSLAFVLLRRQVTAQHAVTPQQQLEQRRVNRQDLLTIALYLLAVGLAFVSVYLSFGIFVLIPLLYVLPERQLVSHSGTTKEAS